MNWPRATARCILVLAAMVVVLAPTAAAYQEAAAPFLRLDVVRVAHSPDLVREASNWTGVIEFRPDHNVSAVSYQVCRVGSVCFIPPTPAHQVNTTTWAFNTATGPKALSLVEWQAGWTVGVQWHVTEASANGTRQVEFPAGLEVGTPACEADPVKCAATHYFTFEVASAVGPGELPSWWLPVALATMATALGTAGLLVKGRGRLLPRVMFSLALASLIGAASGGGLTAWRGLHDVQSAPEFELTSTGFEGGQSTGPVAFRLQDYAGKTLVLDMMAVTCTACRIVAADVLQPLHAEFGLRDDFAMLSIDTWADSDAVGGYGETREELIMLQQAEGYSWRHALDTDDVYRKYAAVQLPKVFVIDEDGDIVYQGQGHVPLKDVRQAVEASFQGQAESVPVLRVGLYGLAVITGFASLLSPCSVGMIPAYLGFLLNAQQTPGLERAQSWRRSLRGGLATAGGIVALYAVVALLILAIGVRIRPVLPYLGPIVAVALVALGAMMLLGFDWSRLTARFGGQIDGRRGFFAFGAGYALAAFGCTGPAFLPILFAGFSEGALQGLLVFSLYSTTIAAAVVVAAMLTSTGHQGLLRKLTSYSRIVSKGSAALMVAAGLYLAYYYLANF